MFPGGRVSDGHWESILGYTDELSREDTGGVC